MVRFDVFAVHQPQYADFLTKPPDVQRRTQIHSRARRIAANIAKLPELVRKTQNNEAANLGGFRVTG
jgi:hypothetical protein